jgi:hypothetical protein
VDVRHDGDVPALWRSLGLPGLLDLHVHFMPRQVLEKVWAYFDAFEPEFGRPWRIRYRQDEHRLLALLRGFGVRSFPTLLYPHKPGMAAWLNGWAASFAARHAEVLQTATFYPEPGVDGYVAEALAAGTRVWKAHLEVGGYDPRDPLLDGVWGRLADAGTPVVVHCGSFPTRTEFTGPAPIGEVLRRHPTLCVIVAHMGAPQYAAFLELAGRYDNVHLDTTMVFTDYLEESAPFPPGLRRALAELGVKIVFGSDFPNIPYPYAHQIAALVRLELGDDWLRGVLHDNAARLGLGA